MRQSFLGMNVEEDNKNYEFLTIGKGRNRKVVNAEIQTRPVLYKSRETEKERVFKKHNYAFASGWDMFDTYADEDLNAQLNPDEDEEFLQATSDGEENKISLDSILIPVDEKQLLNLFKNPRFLEASIVIERLLANNNFNEKQKRFKGLCDPAPFRENIEYKYRLELLWTFSNDATAGCFHDPGIVVCYIYFLFCFRTLRDGALLESREQRHSGSGLREIFLRRTSQWYGDDLEH